MDELKLLEDFRAAVAPPDDEVLARARARVLAASFRRSRGRSANPRRRVRWPQLAVSGAAIAALAVTLSIAAPGGADGTFVTKAWAVERNPDGTVTVTMDQQIQDPAGVQRALAGRRRQRLRPGERDGEGTSGRGVDVLLRPPRQGPGRRSEGGHHVQPDTG